ncbi:hypothetical protein OG749_43530 [Streptomyces nojiriensis]|uniref:hypothetical protein n=1 Tax=Streptomyces nojiriensis TaxID=66374 RepID=UPI002E1865E4
MHIATIIGLAVVAAFTSTLYVRHLSKADRDRYMVPLFLNRGVVPFWIEIINGFVLGVILVLLGNELPLWASFAVFLAAVVPPTELVRGRHNRRVENLAASAGREDSP